MSTPVVMPQMGESIAEGTIVRWIKKVGDTVDRDEPLFEISTDKVDAEIPAPAAGVLLQITVQEGETVAVESVVGMIGAAGESVASAGPVTPGARASDGAAQGPAAGSNGSAYPTSPYPTSPTSSSGRPGASSIDDLRRRKSSPVVRRIARDHNVDIQA